MRINSIRKSDNRCCFSITFNAENDERIFLKNLIQHFEKDLSVNCMLTDLDTSYMVYEKYFNRDNYYVIDHGTSASILAFELNHQEIEDVISNWGYYTFAAVLFLGSFKTEFMNIKPNCIEKLESFPIVIHQVLDTSLDINLTHYYYEEISHLLTDN